MGSTRLPDKSLMKVCGENTLIEMVLKRVSRAEKASEVVLATSAEANSDPLQKIAENTGCKVVRGDEKDVLSRFVKACEMYKPENLVRVCADNPFISPAEIDKLIDFFVSGDYDYAANKFPECGLPDGFGAEIIRADVLKKIPELSRDPSDREHVTKYVLDNPRKYKIAYLKADRDLFFPEIRLDIDTKDDLKKIRKICSYFVPENAPYWSCREIIEAYWKYKKTESE